MHSVNWKRLSWWIAGLALIAALAAPQTTPPDVSGEPLRTAMHEVIPDSH